MKYLLQTSGEIIELGSGNYSTPLINAIVNSSGRTATTIDNNEQWLEKFRYLENANHRLMYIPDWNSFHVTQNYSVAFVDHADAPLHRRWLQVLKLIPYSDFIIVHDSEDSLYGYREIMNMVDVVEVFDRYQSQTLVLKPRHKSTFRRPVNSVVAISTYRMDSDLSDILRVIHSCRATSDVRIIIVDDGSSQEYQSALQTIPDVEVRLSNTNTGIAKTKNRCLNLFNEDESLDVVFLCDDDIEFHPNWHEKYISASVMAPVLSRCDPEYDPSSVFPAPAEIGNLVACDFHNGAFISVARRAFDAIGFFGDFPAKYGIEHVEFYLRAVVNGLLPWRGFLDVKDSHNYVSIHGLHDVSTAEQDRIEQVALNRASKAWVDIELKRDRMLDVILDRVPFPCERCGKLTSHLLPKWGWCHSCQHGTHDIKYESVKPRYHSDIYAAHNGDFVNLKHQCSTNIMLLRRFKPSGPVLDIGCLEGACLASIRDAGMDGYGFDVSCESHRLAVHNGIESDRIRIAELCSPAVWPQQFAAILIREVIEHVPDPVLMLKNAVLMLRSHGIVQIQTPRNGSESTLWAIDDHLRVYSEQSLIDDCRKVGLIVINRLLWPGGMCLTFKKGF